MTLRNERVHLGGLVVLTAGILCSPNSATAQTLDNDAELRIMEPIITEETTPNDLGDWDLRLAGSFRRLGVEKFGFLPPAQLFFGIANRWGGEVELPLAFAFEYSAGHRVQETDADNQIVITGLSHFPLRASRHGLCGRSTAHTINMGPQPCFLRE
jgi:hypothetical protein